MLEKLGQLIQGKKAYLTMLLIFIAGGATALGYVIPEFVWVILGGMGLGSVRSAIGKLEK